jgi:hypothetical protein
MGTSRSEGIDLGGPAGGDGYSLTAIEPTVTWNFNFILVDSFM